LYISYDGCLEPLVQSQVLPYLYSLSKQGFKFILITFDKFKDTHNKNEVIKIKNNLLTNNIEWISLVYHNNPHLPAKVYDICNGFFTCLKLIQMDNIKIIHSRSYIAGVIALLLTKVMNCKFLFDIRGVLPDERVDAGTLNKVSFKYKMYKKLEKMLFRNADSVVVLSKKGMNLVKRDIFPVANIVYIPTCVDSARFDFNYEKRKDIRKKLGLEKKFILVYSGSLGTWYMLNEMIFFFKEFKKFNRNAHWLILTKTNHASVKKEISKHIPSEDFTILFIPFEAISAYLSAADAGISFIKPCYSKQFSCPTKFAEYLACGLPVIINSGIGDTDKIALKYRIGSVINSFGSVDYQKSSRDILTLKNNVQSIHCRNVALQEYNLLTGIERYKKIYQQLIEASVQ